MMQYGTRGPFMSEPLNCTRPEIPAQSLSRRIDPEFIRRTHFVVSGFFFLGTAKRSYSVTIINLAHTCMFIYIYIYININE